MEERRLRAERRLLGSDRESWEDIFERALRILVDPVEYHTWKGYGTLRDVNKTW